MSYPDGTTRGGVVYQDAPYPRGPLGPNPANDAVVYADVRKTTAEQEQELANAHAPFREGRAR